MRFDYLHCNYWEVFEQVRILNQLGYWVDVVDRSVAEEYVPEDRYDLFIGLGAAWSGRHYARYAQALSKAVSIFYNQGQHPRIRQANMAQRKEAFERRHEMEMEATRLVVLEDVDEAVAASDYVFVDGHAADWQEYDGMEDRVYVFNHATHPGLRLTQAALEKKRANRFLFVAGSGNLLKGLDLVLEAFAELPELKVHVCTKLDDFFASFYKKQLAGMPQIVFEDFVLVESKRFRQLTEECAYILVPSCTEGFPHAVATCMRRGLIPVTTKHIDLDVSGYGAVLEDESPEGLQKMVEELAAVETSELRRRVLRSYLASFSWTEQALRKRSRGHWSTYWNARGSFRRIVDQALRYWSRGGSAAEVTEGGNVLGA